MAKKSGVSVNAKKNAASLKAKKAREAKKAASGNAALDRANAVAKKGAPKKVAKQLSGGRVTVETIDAAADGRTKVKVEPKAVAPIDSNTLSKATGKPQFFGRPKQTAAQKDPEAVKAARNAQHQQLMQLDWYRDYREGSIALWVERRKAIAAGDNAAVEKINKKLDALAAKRDKGREEWKAAGAKLPKAPAAKAEKKGAAKKSGSKKGGKAKAAETQPEQPATDLPAADAPASNDTTIANIE